MADKPKKIVPPKQGTAPNGQPALTDSSGRIYMRDSAGTLKRVDPSAFGRAMVDEQWEVAGPEDFKAAVGEDAPWTTFAESAAAGLAEGSLAVPRAAGQLAGVATAEIAGATGLADEAAVEATKQSIMAREGPILPTGREVVAGALHPTDEQERSAYLERARGRAEESPIAATAGSILGEAAGSGAFLNPAAMGAGRLAAYGPRVALGAMSGAQSGFSAAQEDAYIKNIPLTAEQLMAGGGLGLAIGGVAEGAFAAVGAAGSGIKGLRRSAEGAGFTHMEASRSWLDKLAKTPEGREIQTSRIRSTMDEVHVKKEWFKNIDGPDGSPVRVPAQKNEPGAFEKFRLAESSEAGAKPVFRFSKGEMARATADALEAKQAQVGALYRQASKDVAAKPPLQKMFREDIIDDFLQKAESDHIAPVLAKIDPDKAAKHQTLKEIMQQSRDKLVADPTPDTLDIVRQELAKMAYESRSPSAMLVKQELINIERLAADKLTAGMDIIMTGPSAPGVINRAKSQYTKLRHEIADLHRALHPAGSAANAELIRPMGLGSQFVGMTGAIKGVEGGATAYALAVAGKWTIGAGRYLYATQVYRAAKAVENQVHKGVTSAIMKGTSRGIGGARRIAAGKFYSSNERLDKAYERRAGEISSAAANPAALADRLGRQLSEGAESTPKLNGMMVMNIARGIEFLASKLPPDSYAINPLNPHRPRLTASPADMRKFALYWETVNDPRSAIHALAKGRLTIEHVEALKAVYPLMFAEMQRTAMELLAKKEVKLSFGQRSQLDLLLDLNGAGEPSLSPQFQNAMAQVELQQKQQAEQAKPAKPSAKTAKMPDRFQTLSAQAESKL